MPKDLDLYNSAKAGLRSYSKTKNPTSMLKFKTECLEFLKVGIKKLLERSPLKYSMTRGMSCISPEIILLQSTLRLDKCIDKFMQHQRISGEEGDLIREDYTLIQEN